VRAWTGLSGAGYVQVVMYCEHGNEAGNFLIVWVTRLCKKNSIAWN